MNIKTIGAALALGAVVAGCSKEEEPVEAPKAEQTAKADEAVLTVAGEKLMRSQVDADVEALIKAQGDRIPAEQLEYAKQMFRSQIVQGFIAQRALLAMAKAAGYVVTDADRAKRSDEVMKLLARQPDAPKTIDEYFAKFPLGEKRARAEFDAGIVIDKMLKDEQAKAPGADYQAKAEEIVANVVSNNAKAATAEADALKNSPRPTPPARPPRRAATSARSSTARWSRSSTKSPLRSPRARSPTRSRPSSATTSCW